MNEEAPVLEHRSRCNAHLVARDVVEECFGRHIMDVGRIFCDFNVIGWRKSTAGQATDRWASSDNKRGVVSGGKIVYSKKTGAQAPLLRS